MCSCTASHRPHSPQHTARAAAAPDTSFLHIITMQHTLPLVDTMHVKGDPSRIYW
jgi:hypothetical protein